MGTFFPHTVSSIFRHSLTHTHTQTHTQRRSLQMLDVAVPQIGVGVFHAWLLSGGAGVWVSKVFLSTDARRAYPRGVIGSTMDVYPRGTGSNPVKGNKHFFPTYCQLYLSSFSDTHTHTHTHSLSSFFDTHTHTHTHTHLPIFRFRPDCATFSPINSAIWSVSKHKWSFIASQWFQQVVFHWATNVKHPQYTINKPKTPSPRPSPKQSWIKHR